MANPPNISGDPNGFNAAMFKTQRSVARAIRMLGYAVRPDHKTPEETVKKFQHDYNHCSKRFGEWGEVAVNGRIDTATLNALEHAVRWSKKRENRSGTPSARFWRALCSDRRPDCLDSEGYGRMYAETEQKEKVEPQESSFVEVQPNGSAKLRNLHTDDALRCDVLDFERQGDVVFAIVKLPPQADLPNGRSEPLCCPCTIRR